MPPKDTRATKKRKASSLSGQSTLDQYRRVVSSTRMGRDITTTLESGTNVPGSSMVVDSAPAGNLIASNPSSLGSVHMRSPFDRVKISTSKARPSELPEEFFKNSWTRHQELLTSIFGKTEIQASLQQAYESCEAICRYGKSEELFKKLDEHLIAHVKQLGQALANLAFKDEPVLETLNRAWTELCDRLILIRNIFMELDRRYLIRTTKYPSLVALGKHYFNSFVMGNTEVREKGIAETVGLIRMEREGNIIDRSLVRSITNMCLDLELYTDIFEMALLQDTAAFYQAEATQLIKTMSVPQYLEHVRRRCIQESEDRLRVYLAPDTKLRLMDTVIDKLIYRNLITILEQGFDAMMDGDQVQPLRTLYDAVASGKGITELRAAFANYIKKRGENMIKDPKQDSTMIMSLLTFRTKLGVLLQKGFNSDATFANALKESFEAFINSRKSRPAELLAKFIDNKMRQSAKKTMEENMDELLDRLLVLFRYIQGKDTFEAFYKRFLSKRLLLNRSASGDMEKGVLMKLKTECGPGFTKNMEAMFKDIEVSADLTAQFKASDEYPKETDMHFQINVIAQGIWPTYAMSEILLPPLMTEFQTAFTNFYAAQFKGRRLTWQHSLSSCILRAYFPQGAKELTVSLLQATILLLFNDNDMLSYMDIFRATNLDNKELRRILHSLSCGQHKLLLKTEPDMEITQTNNFMYNAAFTAPNTKLKINVLQQEQSGEERRSTETKVLIDRQHQIEAAIVRIMKARKRLTHSELMAELFAQVRFPVEASDFKKRIESLIDREYLTRDDVDSSVYVYC